MAKERSKSPSQILYEYVEKEKREFGKELLRELMQEIEKNRESPFVMNHLWKPKLIEVFLRHKITLEE